MAVAGPAGQAASGLVFPGLRRGVPSPVASRGRRIAPAWQHLRVGDVIPDYGARDATFEVAVVNPPRELVYRSRRGRMTVSWSITLRPAPQKDPSSTRVHLRLRLGPVRRRWLAKTGGELLDVLTTAGLAAGLRERLRQAT